MRKRAGLLDEAGRRDLEVIDGEALEEVSGELVAAS